MNTENKLKIDDFTKALAECINRAQCSVIDPMAHAEIWKEELLELAKGKMPVSEDLEKEMQHYFCKEWAGDPVAVARHFANWQKEQFEKNRLEHCNSITNEQAELEQGFIDQHLDKHQRMPTFLDAIEYGMNLQKEQMMAKAVDVTIAIPYSNGYGGYTQLVDSQEALPFGENIKVLVIKED